MFLSLGLTLLVGFISIEASAQDEVAKIATTSLKPALSVGEMSLVSMLIVIILFTLLTGVLYLAGNLINGSLFNKKAKNPEECGECGEVTGDISAAIAFAISQYARDLHADETNIITIRKVARTYSPWSSKIYQIRKSPRS